MGTVHASPWLEATAVRVEAAVEKTLATNGKIRKVSFKDLGNKMPVT